MSQPRLLVVEDERHLATGLKLNFEFEGYEVSLARTAREAASLLLRPERFEAIILDVMLPDVDGFELCRKLREAGNFTPVIMLTARRAAEDRVRGLEAGADDYLVKPFDLDELLARVRSVLRRRRWDRERAQIGAVLTFGRVRVDFDSRKIRVGQGAAEVEVTLTALEFDLLRYFAENPGRVLSREELLRNVWKLRNYPNTRTVDNFIVRLRKHFEVDPSRPRHFISLRGAGYKFEPGDGQESR